MSCSPKPGDLPPASRPTIVGPTVVLAGILPRKWTFSFFGANAEAEPPATMVSALRFWISRAWNCDWKPVGKFFSDLGKSGYFVEFLQLFFEVYALI
ncbi:MAG: hypothetical protein E2O77_01620 [Caldithrix sp.]|nr:MAG: hypothetical protein E2O77_01620 [Caldithrix sp.]